MAGEIEIDADMAVFRRPKLPPEDCLQVCRFGVERAVGILVVETIGRIR